MRVRQLISLEVTVEVPDDHTEETAGVAAHAATGLILVNKLPWEEYADCQIVEMDNVEDICISTMEVIR